MKDVAAIVVDRSGSQALGDPAADDRRGPGRIAAPFRAAHHHRAPLHRRARRQGRRRRYQAVHGAGTGAGRRTPGASRRDRDAHGRRGPRHSEFSGAARYQGTAPRPRHRPSGRARPADQAPGSAPLRHRRQGSYDPRRGDGARWHRPRGRHHPPRRRGDRPAGCRHRQAVRPQPADRARRPERRGDRGRAAAGRADQRQQPRGAADRGHPREAAGAPRLRRAAPGRADVAQPAEIRRQCRSRALHHPAPAGEAGRHADLRTVVDRLPDARAVRPEDQGFRPDHLRPLRQPERAAAGLFRQHRPLRPRGRCLADRRRPRIRRPREPCPYPARQHPAGRSGRAGGREALQGDTGRKSASATR